MKRLIAHLLGDYVVQSDWMAKAKTTGHGPAVLHGLTYAACFLPLTRNPRALLVIGGTHAVIDRYRLAKYVLWARNQVAPAGARYPLAEAGPFGQRGTPHQGQTLALARRHPEFTKRLGNAYTPAEVAAEMRRLGFSVPMTYDADWLHGWLLFIADNTLHLLINEIALDHWSSTHQEEAARG